MGEQQTFTLDEGHVFKHVDGKLHSENDDAAVTYADGTQWWYHNGMVHRTDGPAVVFASGLEEWWQNNQRHRVGAPAVIYPSGVQIAPELRGVKQWWTQGKLVREDIPPAVARYRQMLVHARKVCFGGA